MTRYKKIENILVVYKKSSLQEAIDHNNKKILDLVKENHPSVADYVMADEAHSLSRKNVKDALDAKFHVEYQYDVVENEVNNYDLVITVGGDGTFLWASKFVNSKVPMLGINSSPTTSFGFFTAYKGSDRDSLMTLAVDLERLGIKSFSKKKVEVDRLSLFVNGKMLQDHILNEVLFAAEHPAAMTKYEIVISDGQTSTVEIRELQSSSGVWISAPAGSTGANYSAGGQVLNLFDRRGQYIVREPAVGGMCSLHGFFSHGSSINFLCKTRKAILACDGTNITIPVTIGDYISIQHSKESLIILGK